MTDSERKALDAVDVDALVDATCGLIGLESLGGRESGAQRAVADLMREAGLEVEHWTIDLDTLKRDPSYHAEVERAEALGVIGRMGGDDGPSLILNGHIDVVPAGEPGRWTVPAWQGTVRDGRVYGRGAADMKGGLCCAIFALRALRDAGITPAGRVSVQSVVGEEDGGLGTLACVRRGERADAAIVLEPTRLTVAPAQAGAFNFRITVPGRAAHGALRAEGVDPIAAFIPIYQALQALEGRRNTRPRHPLFADQALPYALCVGTLRAGVWASTVAESLVCEGRLGVAPDEDGAAARRELVDAVAEAAQRDSWLREHPPVVEWWGGQFEPAVIAANHPIVGTLGDAYEQVCGHAPTVEGMPYGADMRLLVNEGGIPTVLFGPGDVRRAHAPDEFVEIAELEACVRTLVLTILRYCGGS